MPQPTRKDSGDRLGRQAPFVLFALVGTALLIVAIARLAGYPPETSLEARVVSSRDLRVEDEAGGTVLVYDWHGGELLGTYRSGQGSFVRGVLRALTRERRSIGSGAEIPFRLSRHRDGALTIEDLATGEMIVLNAFGPTNAGVFSALLLGRTES
jgi:putative photosynthetic complex assembly protein